MFFSNGEDLKVDESHRIPDKEDAYKLCTLDFDPSRGEKAVILKINILYSHNENDDAFFWEVNLREQTKEEHLSNHPDSTGKICIVVPGSKYQGLIPVDERLVYEPKLVHLDINILPYVGIEGHILNARSTCITSQGIEHDYQAFHQTDPLLVFLLEYKHHFDEVNARDIKKGAERMYLVKRHLVKRIQSFFKNSVFSLIKYVEQPVIEFKWKNPPGKDNKGFVSATIQVDYVVLSPEVIHYKAQGIKLDI
jgi:hypothetical protein